MVRVVLDADGQPTGQSQLCPELAATALAALALPPPTVPVAADASSLVSVLPPAADLRTGRPPRGFSARAPPVLPA